MKSTGNDIVALQFTNRQRTSQFVFYSKFITVAEQTLYPKPGLSFHDFVWLLWSVKESVYKYLKRNDAQLVFSPSKIIIQNIERCMHNPVTQLEGDLVGGVFYTGSVQYQDQTLYFLSCLTSKFIAAVVNDEPGFTNIYWGIKQIAATDSKSQSKAVREFGLNKLSQLYADSDLQIIKISGDYPVVLGDNKEMGMSLSFAHHGNYISYSFIIN